MSLGFDSLQGSMVCFEGRKWDGSKTMSVQAMTARGKTLAQDHKDTVRSMTLVGNAHHLGGQWNAAEGLEAQMMETRKTKLGAGHPSPLTSIANLAFKLKGQGSINRAISLMEDCCELRDVVLNPQHLCTISSRETLTTWRLEAVESGEHNTI
ncbi:kinesin light chain [Periconia macrospinosa]|uniref:Kinesin light chain n=1 Tax=Periconia macrospinosa TaxID=97972 RepID=A0A2V1CXL3_9PLEO|nr:kinesin light chain [Periconia macrospinosa]